jgi:hypothetical protein
MRCQAALRPWTSRKTLHRGRDARRRWLRNLTIELMSGIWGAGATESSVSHP